MHGRPRQPERGRIRALIREMQQAIEQLSDRPARREAAEGHRLLLEHLTFHEGNPDHPNLSANTIVSNARRFLDEANDHGGEPTRQPLR